MPSIIRAWRYDAPNAELLAEAAAVLARGGLIAFPTETVYGVGGRRDLPTTEGRLRAAKRREPDKPFQVLISRVSCPEAAGRWSALVGRFADAFWPGPLTMVIRTASGSWVGFREPDHGVAKALIEAAGGALTASSANLSGRAPARTVEDAVAGLGDAVALAVDGGPSGLGKASSVIRVAGYCWELLREGAVSRQALEQVAGRPPEGEAG